MNTIDQNLEQLLDEVRNFQDIARNLIPPPGELPRLPGIEIAGFSHPKSGLIGGDHIIYLDFNRRYDLDARIKIANQRGLPQLAAMLAKNKQLAGILVADVAGHRITDASLTAMLHQAFLLGVQYELEMHGTITTRLFENINTRFYHSSAVGKYLTMIYGEISVEGTFHFISAGHPLPIVFSNEFDRIVDIHPGHLVTFPPIGTMPSASDPDLALHESLFTPKKRYKINEITLMGMGDIMLLCTDGVYDHHNRKEEDYFPVRLENRLRAIKSLPAEEICARLKEDILAFAPPDDDLTAVVVKRVPA